MKWQHSLVLFLCLCVDTVPREAVQCPWYHLSLKLPHGDLSKWCLYLYFSSLTVTLSPSRFILSFSVFNHLSFFPSVCNSSCYLNHCRQRCKCLHCRPSYKLLMSVSNTSVYLTHHVGCEHLRTSKTLQFACSFLFCLNYRTLPSKPLSQWRHLWNQWNVQGWHIHWICLQVPIRLQRNPLPTQ